MKVRSALGALCATLAVTAGLVGSAGSASAADDTTGGTTGTATTTGTTTGTTTTVTTTPVPTSTPVPVPCVDPVTGRRCHDHDGGFPGGFRDGFRGHFLDLGGVGSLDVCGYSSYDGFANRYNTYRGRFGPLFGTNPYGRFGQLRALCSNPTTIVANDGQCVTYRTDATRYGNYLNDSRRSFNGELLRLRLLHHNNDGLLSSLEIGRLRQARGLELSRLNDWNRSWGQLHTVCSDPTPPVTIINEVPAPAPVVINNNPAPTPPAVPLTGSGNYHYPASAPDTGN